MARGHGENSVMGGRAWYGIGVLLLAYAFSFLDRQILSLLVEPIKRDLNLNDTRISLLQGLAFALVLGLGGLPIGRLVDRGSRIRLIALGIAFWSVMTIACGLVQGYIGLAVARMGVAVGEAVLLPAAFSLITDLVPARRLGLAFGLFSMGVYLGAGAALMGGASVIGALAANGGLDLGALGHLRPWQGVFVIVGLPGLAMALWVATLREPTRTKAPVAAPPLAEVATYLRGHAGTLVCLLLCGAFSTMSAYAHAAWLPSFFIRVHGWTAVQAGHAYGSLLIVFGTLGVVAGGVVGDFLVSRGRANGRLLAMVGSSLAALPFAMAAPLVADPTLALVLIAAGLFFSTMMISNSPAALQEMLPPRMRGIGAALAILVITPLGLGLGPTLVALVTDYVLGDARLVGYSLAVAPPAMLAVSVLFGLAGLKPYLASRAARD
ncbi:MAG: MFS transporter [Azospirillaceae bacterium]|nr:MFS transporter [Azospirillaceae bacterium]